MSVRRPVFAYIVSRDWFSATGTRLERPDKSFDQRTAESSRRSTEPGAARPCKEVYRSQHLCRRRRSPRRLVPCSSSLPSWPPYSRASVSSAISCICSPSRVRGTQKLLRPSRLSASPSRFLATLLVTWIMSKIEKRPNSVYGLGGKRALPNFLAGLAWGVACLSLARPESQENRASGRSTAACCSAPSVFAMERSGCWASWWSGCSRSTSPAGTCSLP